MKKKKLGASNKPYDGGWCVTDGGWCVTDGGWCVTDGGWCVTDGGWCVTDGGWCVTDGDWWVTDGGWWVATKHQTVDAIVKQKGGGVLMAPPDAHWRYGRAGTGRCTGEGAAGAPGPCSPFGGARRLSGAPVIRGESVCLASPPPALAGVRTCGFGKSECDRCPSESASIATLRAL